MSRLGRSVGWVLLVAATGTLSALAPTTAFHWAPLQPVHRLRWNHSLASLPGVVTAVFAATIRGTHAKPSAVDDRPQGEVKSKNQTKTPVGSLLRSWEHRLKSTNFGTVKRHVTETARGVVAAAVLAVVLFLSPLSASAADGNFPRRPLDDAVTRIVSTSPDPVPLSSALARRRVCHFRGGGSGQCPTESAGIRSTSAPIASADVEPLSAEMMIRAVLQLLCYGWGLYNVVMLSLLYSAPSALGKGTSVIQVTVALRVPQRVSPSSILSVLPRLTGEANPSYKWKVQAMMSEVATELLLRKSLIVSAHATSRHFRVRDKALRAYGFWRVTEKVKFQQPAETTNPTSLTTSDDGATMAVVTLLLAIDGHMTRPRPIRSLASVADALRKIAVDSKVDYCLQQADVFWTPPSGSNTTFLTAMDVNVDYPQLRPV
jgi:Protein of unknown function (DUF1517)